MDIIVESDYEDYEAKDHPDPPYYRRHINPDGTKGGLVHVNAHVAKTAYIGEDVHVGESVRIKGRARLLDRVSVSSGTSIEGDTVLCGDTNVSGSGCIRGSAVLSGKCAIRSRNIIIEGYTHLSDIQLDENDMVISGGEFKGSPTIFGGSYLRFNTDENGNITGLYLSEDLSEEKNRREPSQAETLLKYISREEQNLQARDIRGR